MADMTSAEFAERLKKNPVVVLPVGSQEEHGRHLPLQTDTMLIEALVDIVRKVNAFEEKDQTA